MIKFKITTEELRKALSRIDKANESGFNHSECVFKLVSIYY